MSTQRLSNIELLRIGAILMIVMMHGIGYALHSPNEVNRLFVTVINTIGNMGVTVFMLISGFFGIHFKWSRLFLLWMTALFYALVAFLTDAVGSGINIAGLYKALTPITSMTWWFLSWYMVIFCLSPYLNKVVESLSESQMEILLGVLAAFFIFSPTFLFHSMTNDLGGKGLPNMITAYLMGQYIAKYDLPVGFTKHSGKWFLLAVGIVFCGSFVAGSISLTLSNILCKDNNLFVVMGAVALFCWSRKYTFHSSFVNYVASFSLPLYLVNASVLKLLAPYYVGDVNSVSIWGSYLFTICTTVVIAWLTESMRRILFGRINTYLARKIDRFSEPVTF